MTTVFSTVLFAGCAGSDSLDCRSTALCVRVEPPDAAKPDADVSSAGRGGKGPDGGMAGTTAGDGGAAATDATLPECTTHAECGDAGPLCSPQRTCVECLASPDCTSPAAPRCDGSHTCAGCQDVSDCSRFAEMPNCGAASGSCVECVENSQCSLATASKCGDDNTCTACQADADCAHIPGKNVCDDGECVECTGAKYGPCGESEGETLVCNSLTRTCSTQTEASQGLCQPCVSDAACRAGQLCVLEQFGAPKRDVGYFCFWKQGGGGGAPADCPTQGRPYAGLVEAAVSIDGDGADICSLAISTCIAANEFRTKNCAPEGTPDDSLCGFDSGNDATCEPFGVGHRCTMTCLSDDDCPSPAPCDTGASPRVCDLQP